MTHVTGNTQPITSTICAWQYLAQEEVSRLKYDSSMDTWTFMTGKHHQFTSSAHRGADCRRPRTSFLEEIVGVSAVS